MTTIPSTPTVTTEHLPKSRVKFRVTVPQEQFDRCYAFALREASKAVTIEGFRPGRAPATLVEQKVGKDVILRDASSLAVEQTLPNAIRDEKIDAVGRPEIAILKMAAGNEFSYEAIVSVLPDVTLPDYTTIKGVLKVPTIDDKAIDAQLEQLRKKRATVVTVNRPAAKGDVAEIDFEVRMDGVKIEGGESKKHPVVLGEGGFIPGFEEAILGMSAAEKKTFTLTFPKEYHAKHYAGKEATFSVSCNLVQERTLPVLDDAFARSLGPFKGVADLKEKIRTNLEEEAREHAKEEHRNALLEQILKDVTLDLPDVIIEGEIERMIHDLAHRLSATGITLEAYLENIHKTKDDVERDFRPAAQKRVMSYLTLRAIAKREKIEPSRSDIDAEFEKLLSRYPEPAKVKEQIHEEEVKTTIAEQLTHERVFVKLEEFGAKNALTRP